MDNIDITGHPEESAKAPDRYAAVAPSKHGYIVIYGERSQDNKALISWCGHVANTNACIFNGAKIFCHDLFYVSSNTGTISAAAKLKLNGADVQPRNKLPSIAARASIINEAVLDGVEITSANVVKAVNAGYATGDNKTVETSENDDILDALVTLLIGMGYGEDE